MNLRVDLILDQERRSGRVINARLVVRTLSITLPLILATLFALLFLRVQTLNTEVRKWEAVWGARHPKQEQALRMQGTIAANEGRVTEAEAWRRVRLDSAALLRELQLVVPLTTQLTELRLSEDFQVTEGRAAVTQRNASLMLGGKADGPQAKDDVTRLTASLTETPAFTNMIARAFVPPNAFSLDTTPGAPETRRVFRIHCEFQPRVFK
jgi:hypothetical protein